MSRACVAHRRQTNSHLVLDVEIGACVGDQLDFLQPFSDGRLGAKHVKQSPAIPRHRNQFVDVIHVKQQLPERFRGGPARRRRQIVSFRFGAVIEKQFDDARSALEVDHGDGMHGDRERSRQMTWTVTLLSGTKAPRQHRLDESVVTQLDGVTERRRNLDAESNARVPVPRVARDRVMIGRVRATIEKQMGQSDVTVLNGVVKGRPVDAYSFVVHVATFWERGKETGKVWRV